MKPILLAAILATAHPVAEAATPAPFEVEGYAQVVRCPDPGQKKICAEINGTSFSFQSSVEYKLGEELRIGLRMLKDGDKFKLLEVYPSD